MSSDKPVAAGYVRLSQDGESLPDQRAAVNEYAEAEGFQLELYDEGRWESGFDSERDEYQELLDDVRSGRIAAIIVPKLDRLSRDRKDRLRVLLEMDSLDVPVHSVRLGRAVDLDDDHALIVEAARATGDDVQKRAEIEAATAKTQQRVARGAWHGRPPHGCRVTANGESITHGDAWSETEEILALREAGLSYREIEGITGVNYQTARRVCSRWGILSLLRGPLEEYRPAVVK
ncbi:recombinase family protein [Halapricum salinum]|uniref:Resolvase n=1 Tax=Halapricum salinum TaxID=1457250 RepID=A0A4D6HD14_9EURY|nr:recombinase family protein [Halapricum salinum]QCC51461.1 resolvase [Halapricum salinum]